MVVPLPSVTTPRVNVCLPSQEMDPLAHMSFYQEALARVRQRRAAGEPPGAGQPGAGQPGFDLRRAQPKYLRNACIVHPPGAVLPIRRGPPPSPTGCGRASRASATYAIVSPELAAEQASPEAAAVPVALPRSAVIVEALASVGVSIDEGLCRIPPYTWLVLRPGSWGDGDGLGNGELKLAKEAGGGAVAERSLQILSRIPEDRLHAHAAEANFRRAARGASLLALKHAALALRLFGRRKPAESEDNSRATSTPEPENLSLSEEEVAARVRGTEDLVAFRAVVDSKHRTSPARRSEAKKTTSWDPSPPEVQHGGTTRLSARCKGLQAWEHFRNFGIRRYGNLLHLWFVIDPEEQMKIGEMQFARACEGMGYRGNVAALWRYLDMDHSGHITLQEICSSSAVMLADFKLFIEDKFGGSVSKAMRTVDDNHSNRVQKNEFVASMQNLAYEGNAKILFDLLARSAFGCLTVENLKFLEQWNPPPYLFSQPDERGLRALKDVLLDQHPNLLRAWLRVLDADKTMRVSWEEWQRACVKIARTAPAGQSGLPKTEGQRAAAWRALDEDCSGWISLREFDPESFSALAAVKRWVDREHGGLVAKALREAARRGASEEQGIKSALKSILKKDVKMTKSELRLLFEGLDCKDEKVVSEGDLKFLERWDIEWEDWATAGQSL